MFRNFKYWFLTATGVLIIAACENSVKEIEAITDIKSKPAVVAKTIEVQYSDSGIVKLMLKAPKAVRISDEKEPYMEYPEGIDVTFFNAKHEIESNLKAKHAIFYEKKQFWVASDSVVAHNNKEGKILNTEELNWDVEKEFFYSTKFVKITSPEEVLCGEGFEANQTFNNWKIKKIKNSYVNIKE